MANKHEREISTSSYMTMQYTIISEIYNDICKYYEIFMFLCMQICCFTSFCISCTFYFFCFVTRYVSFFNQFANFGVPLGWCIPHAPAAAFLAAGHMCGQHICVSILAEFPNEYVLLLHMRSILDMKTVVIHVRNCSYAFHVFP